MVPVHPHRSVLRIHPLGLLVLSLALLAPTTAQAYTGALQTILIPATSSSTANGTALLNALAGITNATNSKRYLLKLEPGKYDLQQAPLVMKDYVDIEGSGRDSTRILGTPLGNVQYPAVVLGASNSELRDLQVLSFGESTLVGSVGILLGQVNTRILNVKSKASGGIFNEGIVIASGTPKLEQVIAVGVGGSFTSGVVIEETSKPTLLRCDFQGSGATDTNRGVWVRDQQGTATTTIKESTAQADGGNKAYGILASSGLSTVTQVSISGTNVAAFGASIENHAIHIDPPYTFDMIASRANATGTSSYGLYAINSYAVRVHGSTLAGDTSPAFGPSALTIASSGLYGGAVTGSGAVCAGVHDDAFTFYPSTCP